MTAREQKIEIVRPRRRRFRLISLGRPRSMASGVAVVPAERVLDAARRAAYLHP